MKVYVCHYSDDNYHAFANEESVREWLIDNLYYDFSIAEIEEMFGTNELGSCDLKELIEVASDYDYFVGEYEIEDKPEPAKVNAPTYVMMDPESDVTDSPIKQALQRVKEALDEEVCNAVYNSLNEMKHDKAERVKQTIGASEKDSRVRHL